MYLWLYEPVRELYTRFFQNASPLSKEVFGDSRKGGSEDGIAEEGGFWYLTLPFGAHLKTHEILER